MRGTRVLKASFAAVAVALAVPAAAAAATLDGEVFLPTGDVAVTQLACNPAGTSTATLTATGAAAGPFPGTYEEAVRLTAEGRRLVGVEATFTVLSGDTVVTGTKSLPVPQDDSFFCQTAQSAECDEFLLFAGTAGGALGYRAEIRTAGGTTPDEGTSDFQVGADGFVCAGEFVSFGSLSESFTSSQTTPESTPGHATGGGRVGTVVFTLAARSTGTSFQGACRLVDQVTETDIRCLDVAAYVQEGNAATIHGRATQNGVETTYRITVTDNGEAGSNPDAFEIETDAGYSAGGLLSEGNLQVR